MITDALCILLLLFQLVFLLRIVMGFFPIDRDSTVGAVRDVTVAVTDPVLWPLRRALPPLPGVLRGFGIAELVVLIGLSVLVGLIC